MTDLSDLLKYAGSGDKLPGFGFTRTGDGVKGKVLRSNVVEVKTDRGPQTKLVVELEVIQAKGGIVKRDGDFIAEVKDYAAGDQVAVWLPPGFGIGAIVDALNVAGAKRLEEGGTLTIKLAERRDTGKPKPANVYAAVYEPPTGVGLDDLI
jgi:hypothetical protein